MNFPKNVIVDGSLEDNDVVVEESARHTRVFIKLQGKGNRVFIGAHAMLNVNVLVADGATVSIGGGTSMMGVLIAAHEGSVCTIGKGCLFANNIRLRPSDAHQIYDIETEERINTPRPITIEDRVWIGEYTQINKGSTIGNGSIVGAASLVAGTFPANVLLAGVPARVMRTGVAWKP